MRIADWKGEVVRSDAHPAIPQSAIRNPQLDFVTDLPYRVDKPWGHELIWARTDRYVGKVLHIEPGHVLSLQYHNKKDESIYVLTGEIILRTQRDGALIERRMAQGAAFHIEPKLIHQFEAVTATDLLEASTPELDDVVRLQDRYGRVP